MPYKPRQTGFKRPRLYPRRSKTSGPLTYVGPLRPVTVTAEDGRTFEMLRREPGNYSPEGGRPADFQGVEEDSRPRLPGWLIRLFQERAAEARELRRAAETAAFEMGTVERAGAADSFLRSRGFDRNGNPIRWAGGRRRW